MKGYKHTELGWIPEEWDVKSVEDISTIYVGRDLQEKSFSLVATSSHKYPVFSNTVENFGHYGFYDIEEYIGDSLTIVGRGIGLGTAFVRSGSYGAIGRLLVVFPKNGVDCNYLTEFINNRVNFYVESSGIPQLTGEQLSKYKVALPNKIEQKHISDISATWNKAINNLNTLIYTKQQLKKGLMQQLLTGKKRLPGFKGKWMEQSFETIADIIMGQSPDGSTYNQSGIGKPLINGPTEFTDRYPVKMQWTTSPTKVCNKDDVLLCIRGSSTGRINISDDEYCIGRGIAAIRAKNGNDHSFVEFQLKNAVSKILALTSGSTFPNIDSNSLKRIKVMIPEIGEQICIGKVLSVSDQEIELLQEQLNFYKQQKQGLMQQLLTGKKRVKV